MGSLLEGEIQVLHEIHEAHYALVDARTVHTSAEKSEALHAESPMVWWPTVDGPSSHRKITQDIVSHEWDLGIVGVWSKKTPMHSIFFIFCILL
jgi:hypothetical protein